MAEPNWINRTLWTWDNLPLMRGLNSASVDLIYLDPPFNSKKTYSAPIGLPHRRLHPRLPKNQPTRLRAGLRRCPPTFRGDSWI